MWKPIQPPLQSPGSNSTFWWCRPFSARQESVNHYQPLPAWRQKALLK
ncbi:MAG: hypothetical protein WC953_03030 [Pseudomonas sp.]